MTPEETLEFLFPHLHLEITGDPMYTHPHSWFTPLDRRPKKLRKEPYTPQTTMGLKLNALRRYNVCMRYMALVQRGPKA